MKQISHTKKNKSSIPRVILSNYDDNHIYEIKVRYDTNAKLDKIDILEMEYDDQNIVFKKILFNGKACNFIESDGKEIVVNLNEQKKYRIRAKKQNGKVVEDKKRNDKFIVTINDEVRNRESRVEADALHASIDIYKKILQKDNIKSKEIYKVKRYIAIRSKFIFFYSFIDALFKRFAEKVHEKRPQYINKVSKKGGIPIKVKKEFEYSELYKVKIDNPFIELLEDLVVDSLKNSANDNNNTDTNGILCNYFDKNNTKQIKLDLENTQKVFKQIRMALAHYDYDFFDKLFSDNVDKANYPINDIEFLKILLENTEHLNVVPKQNFIDDSDKITILDAEDIKLKRLYTYFIKLEIEYPGFKKLINRLFAEDGKEKEGLKKYINNKAKENDKESYEKLGECAYHFDIVKYRTYKDIYNMHKEKQQKIQEETNGQEIKKLNDELYTLKAQLKEITKPNALKRLEYKLRVAFGFIVEEYGSIDELKNKFTRDIQANKFNDIGQEKAIGYLDTSYKSDIEFFSYKVKQKKKEIKKYIFEKSNIDIADIIGGSDQFAKTVMLFSLFLPKELRGDFLGFIKFYYHKTNSVSHDTKDTEQEQSQLTHSQKIRIVAQNIKKIYLLKENLDSHSQLDEQIYAFKKIDTTQNRENISKYFYANLYRFYEFLFKLINDYEIFLLYSFNPNQNLEATIKDKELKFEYKNGKKGYYNFRTLLDKSELSKDNGYWTISNIRNNIAHQNVDYLLCHFIKENKEEVCATLNEQISEDIYKQWLKKDIATVTTEIIVKMKQHENLKATLGFDAVNDFYQKLVQTVTKLEASNKSFGLKIDKLKNIHSKICKNIKKLKNEEKKKKLKDKNNMLSTQITLLVSLKKINYFFIESHTETIKAMKEMPK